MRGSGRIVNWKHDRGFGFVRDDKEAQDIFVHAKDFKNRFRAPAVGDRIRYKVISDGQARRRAVSVRFQDDRLFAGFWWRAKRKMPIAGFFLIYVSVLALLVRDGRLPVYAVFALFLMSCVTYLFYKKDKKAAVRGMWRTPESLLHLFSLLGGWPGALIAQRHLRHKSAKLSFRIIFYCTILLNVAALAIYAF